MDVKVTGNKMVITADLTPAEMAPLSSTGKNRVLYSSGGFKVAGGHRINLTVIPAK